MNREYSVILAAAFAASCVKDVQAPESTTTEVAENAPMTAVSADGLFEVRIPANASAQRLTITIETRRDVNADDLVGNVYALTIEPSGLTFDQPVELAARLPDGGTPASMALVEIDGTDVRALSRSILSGSEAWATASKRTITTRYHGLAFTAYDPCSGLSCGEVCSPCPPGMACSAPASMCDENGACAGNGLCEPAVVQGWDDPIGIGDVFVLNALAIAGAGTGFDVDGLCDEGGCVDNILWVLGDLMNDQIRQGLLGGETLNLIELAGIDTPYNGDDASATIKLYAAVDADDPFFPANNFQVPAGHTTCCEFKVSPQSIGGSPTNARFRSPARVDNGRGRSVAPTRFSLGLGLDPMVPPLDALHRLLTLERAVMTFRLPQQRLELEDGLIGGSVPVNVLAQAENPYCKTVSPRCPVQFGDSTMLDLVATLVTPNPDVDLDADGLERIEDTDGDGRIDRCSDGCLGEGCTPEIVPPVDVQDPSTCALSPRMADGYSIALSFTAVRASIVGIHDGQ